MGTNGGQHSDHDEGDCEGDGHGVREFLDGWGKNHSSNIPIDYGIA